MAEDAVRKQRGVGHDAITADDFMQRIIEMPVAYIADWLEGKNNLEWLPVFVSSQECDAVTTYSRDAVAELCVKEALGRVLEHGLYGVRIFRGQDRDEYRNEIQYWSNSMGELHYHGELGISEEELPADLRRAYQEIDCFEKYGSRVYLVETENGYGIALANEYDAGRGLAGHECDKPECQ